MSKLTLLNNQKMELRCLYEEKDNAKRINGRKWSRERKSWLYPVSQDVYNDILRYFPNVIVNSNVRDRIKEIDSKEKELLYLKSLNNCDIEFEFESKVSLYNHQKVGVNFLIRAGNGLIGDELGAGKTVQAIFTSLYHKAKKNIDKCVVICPSATKFSVWQKEIGKFSAEKSVIIDGDLKNRSDLYDEFFDSNIFFLVINYALLRIDLKEKHRCAKCNHAIDAFGKVSKCPICKTNSMIGTNNLCLFDRLNKLNLQICLDESIKIKNPKALQTKAVKSIPAKFKIAISGYPVSNTISDIWSQMDWLYPGLLGSYWSFEDKYLIKNYFGAVTGYKNIDKLKSKIEPYYIRRLKKDILDLPSKTTINLDVELKDLQLNAYNQMKKDLYVMINEMTEQEVVLEAGSILAQMIRLSQIAGGYISQPPKINEPIWFKNPAKFLALDDIVQEVLANDKKIVVWSRFVAVTRKIRETYGDICEFIDGSVPSKNRADIIDKFTNGRDLRVLSCQMQTCGMGVNLTAANTEVFMDLAFISPSDYIQAQERLVRPGQTDKVTIINLIAKNTIDEHWARILREKQEIADRLITKYEAVNRDMLLEMLR